MRPMVPMPAALAATLALNALLGFGYRVYRYGKGGPVADVWGQAVLATLLLGLAAGVLGGVELARWGALGYGMLFGVVVMPIWTLGVLIPSDPGRADYIFTIVYWGSLAAIAVLALLG